jgi:hypothetical protein
MGYGRSWMLSHIKARQEADKKNISPRTELNAYLNSPLETDVTDIIAWWGVSSLFFLGDYF